MPIKKINKISIIILTYNRNERLIQQLKMLRDINYSPLEIIVVDNCSELPVDKIVMSDPRAKLIINERNLGAVGRNRGIVAATGDIVITLDNDVYGINDQHLKTLCKLLSRNRIAAVNFKILEENTGRITDWCHPYDKNVFADKEFETCDISEGAVAFNRVVFEEVGLYPEYFFISHEGPDLALRLINNGWKVIYSPSIAVTHAYDRAARQSWRRYYYDTRNLLWLILRNYSYSEGVKRLIIGWGAMLVYSIRDGYFKHWLRAVMASIMGIKNALRGRKPLSKTAKYRLKKLEANKPSFLKLLRWRLFSKEVRI